MDKNKIKVVTLEELKKIDPSNINYMTFTDGSVAIINSDSEDEEKVQKEEKKEKNIEQNSEQKEINIIKEQFINNEKESDKENDYLKDIFSSGEKEPNYQEDPNENLEYESGSDNINNINNININSNNNYNLYNYKYSNQNRINSNNSNINHNNIYRPNINPNIYLRNPGNYNNQKILISNNQRFINSYHQQNNNIINKNYGFHVIQNQNRRPVCTCQIIQKPQINYNNYNYSRRFINQNIGNQFYNRNCPFCLYEREKLRNNY